MEELDKIIFKPLSYFTITIIRLRKGGGLWLLSNYQYLLKTEKED